MLEHKSSVFSKALLVNRTQDKLSFYYKILCRSFEKSSCQKEKHLTQVLVMHYLRFINLLQNDSVRIVS